MVYRGRRKLGRRDGWSEPQLCLAFSLALQKGAKVCFEASCRGKNWPDIKKLFLRRFGVSEGVVKYINELLEIKFHVEKSLLALLDCISLKASKGRIPSSATPPATLRIIPKDLSTRLVMSNGTGSWESFYESCKNLVNSGIYSVKRDINFVDMNCIVKKGRKKTTTCWVCGKKRHISKFCIRRNNFKKTSAVVEVDVSDSVEEQDSLNKFNY